jgi:hypothetical protein
MLTLSDALTFVNGQAQFHDMKLREYSATSPRRGTQHDRLCQQFAALADYLQRQEDRIERLGSGVSADTPPSGVVQLSLRFEDIEGLPPELMQELSITDGDKTDFAIQALMQERGGVMSLDQLLIALYRKTGEIHKRPNLNSRIYRMTTKGALFSVPGRKGVYSTRELTEAESAALERPAAAEATPQ